MIRARRNQAPHCHCRAVAIAPCCSTSARCGGSIELGYLKGLARISSVSGGSITAGMLGLKWGQLGFGANDVAANYVTEVVTPLRALASTTIDRASILRGLFTPGSISDRIADAYREHLFGRATLQDLPTMPPGRAS